MSKIRAVAVVGCGIGRLHVAEGYGRHPGKFHVAALCDLNEERLGAVGEEFSRPRLTTSFEEVLRMDDVDIVDICTPPSFHVPQSMAALAAGKQAIGEKSLELVTALFHSAESGMPVTLPIGADHPKYRDWRPQPPGPGAVSRRS